jgi:hypothetical protein
MENESILSKLIAHGRIIKLKTIVDRFQDGQSFESKN